MHISLLGSSIYDHGRRWGVAGVRTTAFWEQIFIIDRNIFGKRPPGDSSERQLLAVCGLFDFERSSQLSCGSVVNMSTSQVRDPR
jgi:hypothetical protein